MNNTLAADVLCAPTFFASSWLSKLEGILRRADWVVFRKVKQKAVRCHWDGEQKNYSRVTITVSLRVLQQEKRVSFWKKERYREKTSQCNSAMWYYLVLKSISLHLSLCQSLSLLLSLCLNSENYGLHCYSTSPLLWKNTVTAVNRYDKLQPGTLRHETLYILDNLQIA